MSVQQTKDSCYIICGEAESNDGDISGNHGGADYWVAKLSATGSLIWQKSFGGSASDEARSIVQTAEGGFIIAGFTWSTSGDVTVNHGNSDFWIVKLSSTGVLQWQKSFGGSGVDDATSIMQMPDSTYIVSGFSFSGDGDVSGNHGSSDWWLVKLDATGTKKWQKSLGGTTGEDTYFMGTDIHKTNDAGYIVCGSSASNDGDVSGNHGLYDYWAVKLKCGFSVGDITGSHSVCLDASIVLSDTAVGGVWSVSNTNVLISGGVVTGVTAGTVVVTYTLSTDCGAATTIFPLTIAPCPPTINESATVNGISISPNPATTFISITGISGAKARIYNMIGQLIEETSNIDMISVAGFSPGMYFLRLFDAQGVMVRQEKIIKQ